MMSVSAVLGKKTLKMPAVLAKNGHFSIAVLAMFIFAIGLKGIMINRFLNIVDGLCFGDENGNRGFLDTER